MNRIKQLDSLRAIAVILVIMHHSPWGEESTFMDLYPLGANMFMVLSGYLITGILLHEREKAALQGTSLVTLYKNFLAKRALRIFPLYFIVIALLTVFEGRSNLKLYLSLATFTSNYFQYHQQQWNEYAHTWSLSVQEHFYLLWPAVLLYANRKRTVPVILIFILIGIICQKVLFVSEFGSILTPSCFDALGAGALLAWMLRHKTLNQEKAYRLLSLAALSSLVMFAWCYTRHITMPLPFRTLYAVMVMWLIATIVYKGNNSLVGRSALLNNPILPFIGKISFGLYLLHPILPNYTYRLLDVVNGRLPGWMGVYTTTLVWIENYLLLLLVAWLSYRLIELPFMKLKKYFITPQALPVPEALNQPSPAPALKIRSGVLQASEEVV